MTLLSSRRFVFGTALILFGLAPLLNGQVAGTSNSAFGAVGNTLTPPADTQETLRFVLILSRHGVRSPTGKQTQYDAYSAAPWPQWSVAPGDLTAHGFRLMELFGAYDRMKLSQEGLFNATGCEDASKVTFYADSDQRTQETGKALAQGLFPGCNVPVRSLAQGANDTLFHPNPAKFGPEETSLATAAISGRIGNNIANLTEAYRAQLASLDKLLATCGASSGLQGGAQGGLPRKRVSLFDVPSSLIPGRSDHLAELRGPLNTASTLVENLLLEYTEGMPVSSVGWGCVSGGELRSLINLHTAATDYTQRTKAVARVQASNLLEHILESMEQAATDRPVTGAISRPADRALFLIGHDTNLANIAGLLDLNWIADGRRDDTPPGGALVFELWMNRKDGTYNVRTYFTAQTLEQMRSGTELTLANPPERVPVLLPQCGREDFSCAWPEFKKSLRDTIDPRHVELRRR
jgi:4-phytase/acid phosphatase